MKIGFACGVFDLFHAGHVLMLQECKEHCDYLIVALNSADSISKKINPGKAQPIYSLKERITILSSCKFVDEVISYSSEEQLLELLMINNIQIRFLGTDYLDKEITGAELKIEIHYTSRAHGLSTSQIRKRIKNE